MGIAWEYWGEFHSQKDLIEFYGGAGSYVDWTLLDVRRPKKTVGLSAKGVPLDDMLEEQGRLDSPGPRTFSLAGGPAVTGVPVSFSASPIEHTNLYNLKVSVRVDGSSTPAWRAYGTESIEKNLTEFYAAPSGGGYGDVTLYSLQRPKRTVSIEAEGVDSGTAHGLLAMMDRPLATGTFGDFSGIPTSVSISQIKYTDLYNVRVTLRIA